MSELTGALWGNVARAADLLSLPPSLSLVVSSLCFGPASLNVFLPLGDGVGRLFHLFLPLQLGSAGVSVVTMSS